jgi:PAS domain S-box-containing protein
MNTADDDKPHDPDLRAAAEADLARSRGAPMAASPRVAETQLLKAAALQQAIFDSAYFSKIATDVKGVIQIFNVGAERMLGYAAAEVLNKMTPVDFYEPQEWIAHAKALSAEFGTPIAPGFEALVFKASRDIQDTYEMTFLRRDGSRFPAAVSVTALRDAQDAIIGYLFIATDNTARKLADEAHHSSEARLSGVVTSVLDAIVAIDANHRITLFNPAAERMFGLSAAAVLGAGLERLIPSRFRSTHSDHIHKFEETRISARSMGHLGEIFGLHADGSEFPIDASISQHEVNGEKMFTVMLRDVSERERLYQLLQERSVALESARSAADQANLAKSEFLSNMSHELRTPLNAILGFAQLMDAGLPPLTTAQKARIDQIAKAGWYLLDLINEILDLTLIESGKLLLSMEPISLTGVMLECEAMIAPQAQKRAIRVAFPRFENAQFVQADHTRVKQVLINLLSNAIKYNKANGTVVVDCMPGSPGRIRISVSDTGEGLAPERLVQLFQPFNRLGKETGAEEGTGIGLVVTKRLIEMMGGVIGVESTVGVGSVFWIELNLTAEPPPAAGAAELKAVNQVRVQVDSPLRTLLYVEDNPANLMLVEELIASRPDIRLLSAMDGNCGIEIARTSRPDVIVMDINLPGISGMQARRILAEDPATAHIPVIALSANAVFQDIQKALQAGFFRYLTKPIKVNEFMDVLDMALKFAETEAGRATRTKQ